MSHEVTASISSALYQLNKCGTRVLCVSRHLRGSRSRALIIEAQHFPVRATVGSALHESI
jgi:hypothetical protein